MAKRPDGGRSEDPTGIAFPVVAGRRSTTATGRAVFADAARGVAPGLAEDIEAERSWHSRYPVHVRRLVEAGAASPEAARRIAADGLDSAYRRFVIAPGRDVAGSTGAEPTLAQGLGAAASKLAPVEVRGVGRRERGLDVPYQGQRLSGDDLLAQLDRWVAQGTLEPSAAAAIRWVARNPAALDLSDLRVALLGAGAQMGPLRRLLGWGATVLAVDVAVPQVWVRILGIAQRGRGRLLVPVRSDAWVAGSAEAAVIPVAGVDMVTDAAAVRDWLADVDGPTTVGMYGYADGAQHVRLALAMDAVVSELLASGRELSLALLATPTDVYAAPASAVAQARARYQAAGPVSAAGRGAAQAASRGRAFTPNYARTVTTSSGHEVGIADCLVPAQGANYALAKHLQRWRATVARSAGLTVSATVAPPSRTRSVLRSRVLARAYAGSGRFGIETLPPTTSRALMAAVLVHDLRNPAALANPATPLGHPDELFADAAAHGGLWRLPYEPRSLLGPAMLAGWLPRRR